MPRIAGVLGWPLTYTKSPALHNAAYRALGIDAVYVAFPVPDEKLADALHGARALGLMGLNVTVPYKEAVVPFCDELHPTVRKLAAANTLVLAGGKVTAFNTDVDGFQLALAGAGVRARRAVVLGAGGAARAAIAALDGAGTRVSVVARIPSLPGSWSWTEAAFHEVLPAADLLVDATSAGLDDAPYPAPVPLALLRSDAVVASLIYHREPALLRAARERGLRTLDGAGMLVHQAALSFTLMTGKEAPLDVMWTAMVG
ncbi:MAG TPA: shikimate dehydrogenase [Haliangiales bacterium]|nr:shikimate dehydrogenase [Haliangiales bacterium]